MRPRGITLLAMAYLVLASLMALGVAAVLYGIQVPGKMQLNLPGIVVADPQEEMARGLRLHWVAATMFLFLTGFFGGIGWGLWRLKNGARWVAAGVSAVWFVSLLPGIPVRVFHIEGLSTMTWLGLLLLHAGIIGYLFSSSARRAFGAG
ncbi:MAG: hypothetical protein ACRD4D_10410 [Candidatus Acidiferrales bacterium]